MLIDDCRWVWLGSRIAQPSYSAVSSCRRKVFRALLQHESKIKESIKLNIRDSSDAIATDETRIGTDRCSCNESVPIRVSSVANCVGRLQDSVLAPLEPITSTINNHQSAFINPIARAASNPETLAPPNAPVRQAFRMRRLTARSELSTALSERQSACLDGARRRGTAVWRTRRLAVPRSRSHPDRGRRRG